MAEWKPRIERIFHWIRVGNAAATSHGMGVPTKGMIAKFDSSISTNQGDQPMFWTTRFSIEPGTVLKPKITPVTYSANVHGTHIEGVFHVVPVRDGKAPQRVPAARAWVAGDAEQRPLTQVWVDCLPTNVDAQVLDRFDLNRELVRLIHRGTRAYEIDLPQVIHPFVVHRVQRMRPQIARRATVWDEHDAIQAARALLIREALRFATPNRPSASWGAVANRALGKLRRSMWATDWEPAEIIELRAAIQTNPHITADMSAEEIGDLLNGTAGSSGRPRWSINQIEHARTPAMKPASLEAPIGEDTTIADIVPSAENPDDDIVATLRVFFQDAPFRLDEILPYLIDADIVPGDPGSRKVTRSAVEKAKQAFFSVFIRPGEYWHNPSDQQRIINRAFEQLAPNNTPLPLDEMFRVWRENDWRQKVKGVHTRTRVAEPGQRYTDDDGLRRALRHARTSAGMTRTQVADEITVTLGLPCIDSTICAWEEPLGSSPIPPRRVLDWYAERFDRFVDPEIEFLAVSTASRR